MGFLGGTAFGFLPNSTASGGPSTGVATLKLVVGAPGAPVAGTSTYINAVLVGKNCDYIVIGNVPLFGFGSNPDFVFTSGTGQIDISPNKFPPNGNAVFIQYEIP